MNVKISPQILSGKIKITASKSYAHRAIIASSLALGESHISNYCLSNDMSATIEAMKALGAKIEEKDELLIINGSKVKRKSLIIDCLESGSTMRFLIPIAMVNNEPITFVGHNNLVHRPITPYLEIFKQFEIDFEKGNDELPILIKQGLKNGNYQIKGDVSSQFITGLLFALPLLGGDSIINITTELESKGYIDLTLDILEKHGIKVVNDSYKRFYIKGNQKYQNKDYYIEGDFSQAAFFIVAGIIGNGLVLTGMNKNSLQGDKKILDIVKSMGANFDFIDDLVIYPSNTTGTIIDLSQCPDLGPILTVLAALSKGKTQIINASRLRIKESDRILSITTELRKLGANIEMTEDGMVIEGVCRFNGGCSLDSWNDHRIAMSLAIASIRCDKPIIINNMEAINKSYPKFISDFNSLGGKIDVTTSKE